MNVKNNLKGLGAYIAYIFLSFFILYYGILYVKTFYEGGLLFLLRILVFVCILALPVLLGALVLDTTLPEKDDFKNGLFVIAVAFLLYIIALIVTKGSWWNIIPSGAEGDGWRFFKFFAMPGQSLAYCFLDTTRFSALYLLLTCFLPTFLFGLGIKANRSYQAKKVEKGTQQRDKKRVKK